MATTLSGRTIPEPKLAAPAKIAGSRGAWRFVFWAGFAAVAVAAAALTLQSDIGTPRLALAWAAAREVTMPAAPPIRAAETEAEIRRLADAVRQLTSDRNRLAERLITLERQFDDMTTATGSINKTASQQPSREAAPPPAAFTPPSPPVLPTILSTTLAAPVWPAQPATAPEPPVAVASADAVPAATEFGVDLGGAVRIEALRGLWNSARLRHGPLLAGLQPFAVTRQGSRGPELRLVAGPLADTTAAQLCAALNAARTACHPAELPAPRTALR